MTAEINLVFDTHFSLSIIDTDTEMRASVTYKGVCAIIGAIFDLALQQRTTRYSFFYKTSWCASGTVQSGVMALLAYAMQRPTTAAPWNLYVRFSKCSLCHNMRLGI